MSSNNKLLTERLLSAVTTGNSEALLRLLQAGGRTTIVDFDRRSLLSLAAYHGHPECVKILLDFGADVEFDNYEMYTPLAFAAKNGHSECVKLLIEAGANVNRHTADGSPLTHAAHGRDYDCLRLLLDAGAFPNAKTCYGGTALSIVLENGQADSARLLLERGAHLHGADGFAFDEMMRAVLGDNEECIQLVLNHGGNPYYIGRKQDLALFDLISEDDGDEMRRLLQQGADVNVKDANGQTPLFHALRYSSVDDCLYLLLAAGADENIRDNDGMTAWEFSAKWGLLAHSNLSPDVIRKAAEKYKAQIN